MSTKKQFKRDTTQNSDKLHLDQYYTPDDVAQHCIDTAYRVIGKDNISCVIEPSADTDAYRDWETDRKSTRLNYSHSAKSRMPSSA